MQRLILPNNGISTMIPSRKELKSSEPSNLYYLA